MKDNCYLLYTDGSCYKGKGGWGWILKKKYGNYLETIDKNCAGVTDTTISRMEMTAILDGLMGYVEKRYINPLFIISDSEFVVNSFNKGWFKTWSELGFIDRPNADLWKMFEETFRVINFPLKFIHTRGHEKGMEFHIQGNSEVDFLCSYKNFHKK